MSSARGALIEDHLRRRRLCYLATCGPVLLGTCILDLCCLLDRDISEFNHLRCVGQQPQLGVRAAGLIAMPAVVGAGSKRCHGTGELGVHRKSLLPACVDRGAQPVASNAARLHGVPEGGHENASLRGIAAARSDTVHRLLGLEQAHTRVLAVGADGFNRPSVLEVSDDLVLLRHGDAKVVHHQVEFPLNGGQLDRRAAPLV